MSESHKLIERKPREPREFAGIEFVAGDDKYHLTGVDEPREQDNEQIRFEPKPVGRVVLDSGRSRQEFATVQHLTVPFGLEARQNVPSVARAGRIDTVALR